MRGWGGGEYQDLPSEISCPTVPKNFAGERGNLLCFTTFLVSKKIMDERGEYHDFMSKVFCLTVPKNFVREPFCAVFQKSSRSENVYG